MSYFNTRDILEFILIFYAKRDWTVKHQMKCVDNMLTCAYNMLTMYNIPAILYLLSFS